MLPALNKALPEQCLLPYLSTVFTTRSRPDNQQTISKDNSYGKLQHVYITGCTETTKTTEFTSWKIERYSY